MADDRPVEDPTEMVARLASELDDLKSTMLARLTRRPTGDVELAIRSTPKPGTLFMQGQIVSRTTYAALWQWVNDNSLLMAGLFGPADGSTTFGLPNFAGRVPVGTSASLVLGALVGTDSLTLTSANVPSHTHTVGGSGTHGHNGTTSQDGSHGAHVGQNYNAGPGSQFTVTADNSGNQGGNHSHGFGTSQNGDHDHDISGPSGAVTPIDNRQSSIAINWAIWT